MVIELLREANRFYLNGDFHRSLRFYEDILKNIGDGRPEAFKSSIRAQIALCERKLSHFQDSKVAGKVPPSGVSFHADNSDGPNATLPAFEDINVRLTGVSRRLPFVLMVNPSHAHRAERQLWTGFCKRATSLGFQAVDLAFRKSEAFPASRIFVHPARAYDLASRLRNYDDLPMPAWATEDTINLMVDWEHRRWEIPKYNPEVRRGIDQQIRYIDHSIKTLNPTLVITTNKVDPPNYFAYLSAIYYQVPYVFVERSPLNSYLIERFGMFAESDVVERVLRSLTCESTSSGDLDASSRIISDILESPYGFREPEASKVAFTRASGVGRTVFFLPLDNALWTGWAQSEHPQGDVDYPLFRTPEEAIRNVARSVAQLNGTLLIKPHPSCKEWPRIAAEVSDLPNLRFIEADLNQLVSSADVVVTFLTKVSYLALARGKPVISFGGGLLDYFGVTYQVKSRSMLDACLQQARDKVGLDEKITCFQRLLPHLEKTFYSDGERIASRLISSASIVPLEEQEINALLDRAFDRRQKKPLSFSIPLSSRRPIIVFDVSRLLNKSLEYSGVSRYVRELVVGLAKTLNISLICAYYPQNNPHGLSAYYLSKLQSELALSLYPIADVLKWLDEQNESYIYHSPISPLPPRAMHPKMQRVITIHDIFHVTRPEHYDASKFITVDIINSVDPDKDAIIFVSDYSKREYEAHEKSSPRYATVTHLAVSKDFHFRGAGKISGVGQDRLDYGRYVVVPCQGDPRKGFARMMKIAGELLDAEAFDNVVVIGGPERRGLFRENLPKRHLQEGKWHYLSALTDTELSVLYGNALLHLYLSEAEGFGLPPLEAMRCGCPSIMLANTSLAEVYEGWRLLLPNVYSDAEIVNLICSTDFALLRDEACEFASKFSWERTVALTVDFYASLSGVVSD